MSTPLVFLDTETTGLNPERHSVWEIAWAVEDGPIRSAVVAHSREGADPRALELNGYRYRIGSTSISAGLDAEAALMSALEGATVVGSNPAFDTAFLRRRWGVAPWRHRLLDVAAYAMGVLDQDRPEGLAATADRLRVLGYEIPEPDHSAAADVTTLRDVFNALRTIAAARA